MSLTVTCKYCWEYPCECKYDDTEIEKRIWRASAILGIPEDILREKLKDIIFEKSI